MARSGPWSLLGLGVGAVLVYLLEPGVGRRRYHRARGVMAEVTRLLSRRSVPDDVLEGRVRASLPRLSSHPHTLRVTADRGQVTVTGRILTREAHGLVRGVSQIAGVEAVVNELEIQDDSTGFPADRRSGRDRRAWPSRTRLAAAMTGGALAAYATRRRGLARLTLAGTGAALLMKSLQARHARRRTPADHVVSVHKTLEVDAPVADVFEAWTWPDCLPRFLGGLRAVQDLGAGVSLWTVVGPDGREISWETELTGVVPEQLLSWRTREGAPLAHQGIVRFRPTRRGGTQIEIELDYDPPAGALAHAAAELFGADPQSGMDADLARLKAALERPRSALRPAIDPPLAGA